MDMTLNKKLLLTLFLFFFTTSFFEGMIIKSLATCQRPCQKHIKFVMTLTGVPFQVYFAIVGQNPNHLTLFSLYEQYYKHILFVLVSIFYLHGNF